MIGSDKVLALIPARGGSKGVPGKNIRPVGGRPLIEWTIAAARESRYIDRTVLSSDDPAIVEVAQRAGCDVPFRRDAALATDAASSVDVLADALRRVPGFGIAVLLQPTSPLRNSADIDGTLERLHSSAAPSCVTVRPAEDHPFWTYRIDDKQRLAPYCAPSESVPTRRQELPPAWCLNGAAYAVRVDWFLQARRFTDLDTVAYPMPSDRSIDIDTFEDFERLEIFLSRSAAAPLSR